MTTHQTDWPTMTYDLSTTQTYTTITAEAVTSALMTVMDAVANGMWGEDFRSMAGHSTVEDNGRVLGLGFIYLGDSGNFNSAVSHVHRLCVQVSQSLRSVLPGMELRINTNPMGAPYNSILLIIDYRQLNGDLCGFIWARLGELKEDLWRLDTVLSDAARRSARPISDYDWGDYGTGVRRYLPGNMEGMRFRLLPRPDRASRTQSGQVMGRHNSPKLPPEVAQPTNGIAINLRDNRGNEVVIPVARALCSFTTSPATSARVSQVIESIHCDRSIHDKTTIVRLNVTMDVTVCDESVAMAGDEEHLAAKATREATEFIKHAVDLWHNVASKKAYAFSSEAMVPVGVPEFTSLRSGVLLARDLKCPASAHDKNQFIEDMNSAVNEAIQKVYRQHGVGAGVVSKKKRELDL